MSITLKPETERVIQEEISSGHFRTVDELILQGVQAWREKNSSHQTLEERREAVARMQEFAEKNRTSLGDISVKDLIHEGHRL
jgi:Arc/MetJ-type ribon-helix-helix transcriptional regulator